MNQPHNNYPIPTEYGGPGLKLLPVITANLLLELSMVNLGTLNLEPLSTLIANAP